MPDENIRSQANHLLELKPQAGPLMGDKNWFTQGPEITQKDSNHGWSEKHVHQNFTELDDGKILTGNPYIWWEFYHGFRLRLSLKPIHWKLPFWGTAIF